MWILAVVMQRLVFAAVSVLVNDIGLLELAISTEIVKTV